MGLIQREIEKADIATISVTLSQEITKKLKLPRAVFTGLPMGHPYSFPHQEFRQLSILRVCLKHLEKINEPGTIVDVNMSSNDDPAVTCEVCGS